MKTLLSLLAVLAATCAAAPVSAQSADQGVATLEIHRGLNVSTIRPLRIQLQPEGSTLGISAVELTGGPALVEVTGDANRIYRVQVLSSDASDVSFDIWSTNAGDISESRISVMDSDGRDLLRITGDPEALRRLFGEATQIPLNIQYE